MEKLKGFLDICKNCECNEINLHSPLKMFAVTNIRTCKYEGIIFKPYDFEGQAFVNESKGSFCEHSEIEINYYRYPIEHFRNFQKAFEIEMMRKHLNLIIKTTCPYYMEHFIKRVNKKSFVNVEEND